MLIAESPLDEEFRLKDLDSYEILDTRPESDFDELVELAGQICHCPISLISLLDKDRQWFKAKTGLTENETSRDIAFCSHAILEEKVMVVQDAVKDERFYDNPLVTGDLNIRFYAGAPILSPGGFKLGTICVIDHEPKNLTPEEERALTLLSKQVTKLIVIRKKNMQIRQRAEEIVLLKSKAIARVIQDNLDKNKTIAINLHEDLAQGIASSILFLKSAGENDEKRLSLIHIAEEQLQDILEKIKALSYSLTPATASWMLIEDLVQEYIKNVADTFSFEIQFRMLEHRSKSPTVKTPLVINIIERWLKKIASKREVSQLLITMNSSDQLELVFEDNAPYCEMEELVNDMSECLLPEMTLTGGGSSMATIPEPGRNVIRILMPL